MKVIAGGTLNKSYYFILTLIKNCPDCHHYNRLFTEGSFVASRNTMSDNDSNLLSLYGSGELESAKLSREVDIPVDHRILKGNLVIPPGASAIIIFSHGSGSSRFSSRNLMVAEYLQNKGFGTLLFDLLTAAEDLDYGNRFDIDLLTKRLAGATKWLQQQPAATKCRFGYFGASTGAASALKAAMISPAVEAIVSRGGRPDLAMDILHSLTVPTLLIVGSRDPDVLQLNKHAYQELAGEKKIEIIEGATHLFPEPGTMEKVCEKAAQWFSKYLPVTEMRA